jgi:hypothetical protein
MRLFVYEVYLEIEGRTYTGMVRAMDSKHASAVLDRQYPGLGKSVAVKEMAADMWEDERR